MSNDAPVFAPDPEGLKISERFLLGDLIKVCVQEMKLLPMGWGVLPEKGQQEVIERMTDRIRTAVKEVVHMIAANNRPHILASVDSVTFKDGVKVQFSIERLAVSRHELADAQGGTALIVLPMVNAHLGGDAPKPAKDQPDLPLNTTE